MSVNPANSYSGTVQLWAFGMPMGASAPSTGAFVPASLTFSNSNTPQTATLTVNTTAGSPPGNYALTIYGMSGSTSRSTTAWPPTTYSLLAWNAQNPSPTLASINPASGARGTAVPVTLTGTGFVQGAVINPGNGGIAVNNIAVQNPNTITATFTIAPGASTGAGNATVTTSGGTSGAVVFAVN